MKSNLLKKVAAFLFFVFVFNTFTPMIYGVMDVSEDNKTSVENNAINTEDNEESVQSDEQEAEILSEIENKREKNVKYFDLSNGSIEAEIYPSAVHYEKDGKWVDIDNTLVESVAEDGQAVMKNKENSFSVEFAKEIDEEKENNNLLKLEDDKISIEWKLEGTNKTKLEKKEKVDEKTNTNENTNSKNKKSNTKSKKEKIKEKN